LSEEELALIADYKRKISSEQKLASKATKPLMIVFKPTFSFICAQILLYCFRYFDKFLSYKYLCADKLVYNNHP